MFADWLSGYFMVVVMVMVLVSGDVFANVGVVFLGVLVIFMAKLITRGPFWWRFIFLRPKNYYFTPQSVMETKVAYMLSISGRVNLNCGILTTGQVSPHDGLEKGYAAFLSDQAVERAKMVYYQPSSGCFLVPSYRRIFHMGVAYQQKLILAS